MRSAPSRVDIGDGQREAGALQQDAESRTSAKGATRGRHAAFASVSAAAKDWRSSVKVAPPSSAASSSPSGRSARRICAKRAGQVVDEMKREPGHGEIEQFRLKREQARIHAPAGRSARAGREATRQER